MQDSIATLGAAAKGRSSGSLNAIPTVSMPLQLAKNIPLAEFTALRGPWEPMIPPVPGGSAVVVSGFKSWHVGKSAESPGSVLLVAIWLCEQEVSRRNFAETINAVPVHPHLHGWALATPYDLGEGKVHPRCFYCW